jgi:hypothetical protein
MNNNIRTPRPKLTSPPPPPPRTPQWITDNLRIEAINEQRAQLMLAVKEHASTVGARRQPSASKYTHACLRVDEPLGKLLGMMTRDELAEQLAYLVHGVITVAYREGLDNA